MKLIIAGSRNLHGKYLVQAAIDLCKIPLAKGLTLEPNTVCEVVSGGAKGIDTAGEDWAYWNGEIPVKEFPANWDVCGKSAGHIRNKEMDNYADELLAIWDGHSKGTLHMITEMQKLGKPVHIMEVYIK